MATATIPQFLRLLRLFSLLDDTTCAFMQLDRDYVLFRRSLFDKCTG